MTDRAHSGPTDDLSTLLVTGAAGGLGVHLVETLSRAGWRIVAFDRSDPVEEHRDSLLHHQDHVEWFRGSGTESEFRELLSRCDGVVHAAGVASLSADEHSLFATNRDLPRRLFSLCCDADIEHVVHISCASVYRADVEVRDETSPTQTYNEFEESKLAGERAIRDIADRREDAPALTILRLGLLYGPGCTSMGAGMVTLPAILRDVSRYLPGISGGPRTNWCHVEDAASAVQLLVGHPEADGEIFNVADDTALSFGEVLNSVIEGYDIDLGPSVRIPSLALWAVLSPLLDNDWAFQKARSLLRWLWRRVQRDRDLDSPLTPRLDRDALFYVRDDAILVADKLRSLGWEPQWPDYREGIAETIRWYQQEGWAPNYELDNIADRHDEPASHLDYDEHLTGHLDDPSSTAVDLHLELSWPSIPWPLSGGDGLLQGRISIPGIADSSPLIGTVELRWMPVLQLEYEFGFRNLDDRACRFHGTRRFDATAPSTSLRRIQGTLVDRYGETIADVVATSSDGPIHRLTSPTE